MKSFFKKSLFGIGLGSFLMVIITNAIYLFGGAEVLSGKIFFHNTVGLLFLGWIFVVSTLLYEIERLKLFQQTLLHFLTISIPYLVIAKWLNWLPSNPKYIIGFVIFFIIDYFIIWTFIYLHHRSLANKLNNDLRNL